MSEPLAPRHPRLFWTYYAAVLTAALAAFIAFTPQAGPIHPVTAAVVLVLMMLSEATPMPLPGGGYVSVGAVLDLACLLILGPVYTAWFNAIATFVAQTLVLRKPLLRTAHNMAIFALAAFASGYAFIAAGGTIGKLDVGMTCSPCWRAAASISCATPRLSRPCSG